jgi:hypothetical protein
MLEFGNWRAKVSRFLGFASLTLILAGRMVQAGPILVDQSPFTSPTTLDFSGIGNEVPIDVQFAGQGVTFAGGLYGLTNPGDINTYPGPPTVIASDWRYSQGGSNPGPLPITATFATVQNLVGFLGTTNSGDSTVITTFLGGISDGSVSVAGTGSPAFLGVSDSSGFDSITIDAPGTTNEFLSFNGFEFQSTSSVPEPGSAGLIAGGIAGITFLRSSQRKPRR